MEFLQTENECLKKKVKELEETITYLKFTPQITEDDKLVSVLNDTECITITNNNSEKYYPKKDILGYSILYKIKKEDPELFNTIIENT